MIDNGPVYMYILTAGRTGSTYIDNLLRRSYPEIQIFAEREPARSLKFLNNIGLIQIPLVSALADNIATWLYKSSREKWIRKVGNAEQIIEINPFIVGLGCHLASLETGPDIHIVRHPVSWVRSSIGFGSYSWRRAITPYIPFARERPPFSHQEWSGWTEVEKFAWRWLFRNMSINEFAKSRPKDLHRIVRYEDLFRNGQPDIAQFRVMASHLNLNPDNINKGSLINNIANPTLEKHAVELTEDEEQSIMKICADLANKYGYV